VREKEPEKITVLIEFLLMVILAILMSFPINWFSVDKPVGERSLRPISNSILFLIYLIALVRTTPLLAKRISEEKIPLKKAILRFLVLGNVLIGLFFLVYAIDRLIPVHYSVFLIIGLIFLFLSMMLYYLAILPLSRFISRYEK